MKSSCHACITNFMIVPCTISFMYKDMNVKYDYTDFLVYMYVSPRDLLHSGCNVGHVKEEYILELLKL